MTSSEVWDQETAERYDDAAADRSTPEVLGPTVDFLARLAGNGRYRQDNREQQHDRSGDSGRGPPAG